MKIRIYSPGQIFMASLFGGFLAAIYFLRRNFQSLGKSAEARQTLIWGGALFVGLWATWPFVREWIPRSLVAAFATGVALAARQIAKRWQLTKEAIQQSDQYSLQSNWRVFFLSISFLIATVILAVLYVIGVYPEVRDRARSFIPEFNGRRAIDRGDYVTAISELSRAIELDPRDGAFYFDRAWAKSQARDLEGAIADYKRSIALDTTDAKTYNNLAWLLATANNPSLWDGRLAVEFGLKACELSQWRNPAYIGTLAAAYARNGESTKAVEMHLKAMQVSGQPNTAKSEERLRLYREGKAWPPD